MCLILHFKPSHSHPCHPTLVPLGHFSTPRAQLDTLFLKISTILWTSNMYEFSCTASPIKDLTSLLLFSSQFHLENQLAFQTWFGFYFFPQKKIPVITLCCNIYNPSSPMVVLWELRFSVINYCLTFVIQKSLMHDMYCRFIYTKHLLIGYCI